MTSDYEECEPGLSREQVDRMVKDRIEWLKRIRSEISDDHFLGIVAAVWVQSQETDRQVIEYERIIKDYEFALGVFSSDVVKHAHASKEALLEFMAESEMLGAKMLVEGLKIQKSRSGKHAVKHREDQLLKANWQQHVISCVERKMVINNLKDLLDIAGYDERLCHIQPVTLKAWAKEAVPTLKFKAGRPK